MKVSKSIILGFIAGIIFLIAWYLLARSIGFYEVKVYVYAYIVLVGLMLVGICTSVYLEKKRNMGFLEFRIALKEGMLFSLIFAIMVALANYFYYKFITPDSVDYFVSEAKKYGETVLKLKPADLVQLTDRERANFGSAQRIPFILFWGLIISLISGLIFQKKNPHEFSAN